MSSQLVMIMPLWVAVVRWMLLLGVVQCINSWFSRDLECNRNTARVMMKYVSNVRFVFEMLN